MKSAVRCTISEGAGLDTTGSYEEQRGKCKEQKSKNSKRAKEQKSKRAKSG
jgi:hypothetical protein